MQWDRTAPGCWCISFGLLACCMEQVHVQQGPYVEHTLCKGPPHESVLVAARNACVL